MRATRFPLRAFTSARESLRESLRNSGRSSKRATDHRPQEHLPRRPRVAVLEAVLLIHRVESLALDFVARLAGSFRSHLGRGRDLKELRLVLLHLRCV